MIPARNGGRRRMGDAAAPGARRAACSPGISRDLPDSASDRSRPRNPPKASCTLLRAETTSTATSRARSRHYRARDRAPLAALDPAARAEPILPPDLTRSTGAMTDVRFTAQSADRAEYESWFTNHGGNIANDAIAVDGATAFFRQSGLPTPVLSAVWAAANRSPNPGSLRFIDFAAAANLLLQIARGQLTSPPSALPPKFFQDVEAFAKPKLPASKSPSNDFDPFGPGAGSAAPPLSSAPASAAPRSAAGSNTNNLSALLFDDAPGTSVVTLTPHAATSHDASRAGGPSPSSLHRTGPPPLTPLQPQSTGASAMLGGGSAATIGRTGASLPSARSMTASAPPMIPAQRPGSAAATAPMVPPTSSTSTVAAWAVPTEKQQLYGGYFADVDVSKKGFATANECYDFFLKSNLPPADLRHIWTLVTALDPHPPAQPQLKRDEFILAMHLIMDRLAGHAIPDPLPADLIPPARRSASPPLAMASAAKNASIVSLAPTPPNPVAPASFDEIIGGGGGSSGAASALGGIGLLAGLGATTAGRVGSPATPASATVVPRGPTPAAPSAMAGGPGSFGSFPALNLGGASGAPSAAASQLPEAQDLAALTSKTEALSLHRIETTNSINALSIEKQNLTIRLGQVKAAHDAEQQLLDSLKTTFETERKTVDSLKDEVLALERARQEIIAEKASLNDQMAAHRRDAETARNRIVALNFEINTMRQELAGLRAQAARERENAEFNQQSVQNIEETKGAIASQVDDERRKRANMPPPPVPAQRPTQVVTPVPVAAHATGGSTVSTGTSRSATAAAPVAAHATGGSTFSRPTTVAAAAPVFAHATGGSTFSTTSGRPPVGHGLGNPLSMPASGTPASLTGSISFDPFAPAETTAPTAAPAPRPPSLDQLRSTSPTATSIRSFEQAFPSPSKLGNVASSSPVAPAGPPAVPAARAASNDDVPDEYKNEFDAFAFNFPPVSPPGGAAGSPSAPSAALHDPFAAMGAAPVPVPASSSAAAPAAGAATWGADFDPFGAPSAASAPMPAAPASAAPAPFDDPFAALSATAPTSASAAFGASAAVDDAFDPFAAPSASPASVPALPGRPVGTPPPADAVAAVMALGFSHDQAVSALKRYDNDPGKASNYLIDEAAKQ
ncbi:hypothetical protein AMAG_06250 [Allomyces macrogynus ATCC 38327]|uniref:UBA domain-containing protein n=1 Tax=Allomyces macrogynus (strain ATCC 38327) TaxID=578462 RepID=A0A0L0SFZ5_ALLM3|nr:hypothetical protein AMAG_06250 [Allomyces macrogynus ATCC 38327]|eukprot:KNE61421.1 hypothetical protein AMAG_06250 [Allomyces macrogynus ATCC 38327]